MRLLFLVVLNCGSLLADWQEFKDAEKKVIGYMEADVKELNGKIANLIKSLPDNSDKASLTSRLEKFLNVSLPAKFLINVTGDYFERETISEAFKLVEQLLSDTVISKTVEECSKPPNPCQHPLTKLSNATEKENKDNLISAIRKYTDRPTETEALQNVTSKLANFESELQRFPNYIYNELDTRPEDADIFLSGILTNVSLPDMDHVFNGTEQRPGVKESLKKVLTNLMLAGDAIEKCRQANVEDGPLCTGKVPLASAVDKSNIEAVRKMIERYNERPLAPDTVPTTVDPKPSPTNSTNTPDVDSSSVATTAASTDNNGGNPKPDDKTKTGTCCQLCLLPAMPPNYGNCQSGNQCNCGCSCNSGNTRGCRSQNKCCSSNSHCKDNCCEKGHHEDKKPVIHTEVITIPPAKSSSSPLFAFVSAVSLIATLMR